PLSYSRAIVRMRQMGRKELAPKGALLFLEATFVPLERPQWLLVLPPGAPSPPTADPASSPS
ncbi:MAG: hypothetical protein WAM99_02795, partial [Xanthobacteraceae bacterium]